MTRLFLLLLLLLAVEQGVNGQGQVPLAIGVMPPREQMKNSLGGVYSNNISLWFMNSPYRVQSDLTVEAGATLTIETGVQIYFDSGVGLIIKGAIHAVANEYAHIQFLPYQQQLLYDSTFPDFRLIDGPSVRQGRLQVRFRDRWRSVCTQLTNWTSIDYGTACRSMGYSDGGWWQWYRRNNDTYPFVMPEPACHPQASNLWQCQGMAKPEKIALSENLCQGEDDLGLICWGPPIFTGWARHWKGIQIFNSPFEYVHNDPDSVSVHKESMSRLEYVDILYAGYDGSRKNTTAALYIEGVPPYMNGLRVAHSARDGIYMYEPSGPILIANSTIIGNRGHGLVVDNTTDGRLFVNYTLIEGNYGDGVWYRQKAGGIQLVHSLDATRNRRQAAYFEEERPLLDMCRGHTVPKNHYFPHLIRALIKNGTIIDTKMAYPCWVILQLPPRLAYTYTLQFTTVVNLNPWYLQSGTALVICDANADLNGCANERQRIPIRDGIFPQSLSIRSAGRAIFLGLQHSMENSITSHVIGDIDLQFRVHASVIDKAFYGLNITNSIIDHNIGNGIFAKDIRDRFALTNVSVSGNQGIAGLLVRDGAADLWLNDTRIDRNWGDGMNVSYAGGSITVNGTSISRNRWRGCAFHHNTSSPFMALHQEIIFKGRPSNNINYLRTIIDGNLWGGILIGNFCIPTFRGFEPKVLISWVEMVGNEYHPALEIFACQSNGMAKTIVDVTGSRFEAGSGMGFRMAPLVNSQALISSNQFLNNNNSALIIRNSEHPQLSHLFADVTISKNSFKFNRAQYIVLIGLNEDAPNQRLIFNQQNEIRENTVINPFPYLKPRSTPYAALVVSSSNTVIHRNCFKNPNAEYEIATDLMEHAKWIEASENNWGHQYPEQFMNKIFDQFNRYSLAVIGVNPFAAVCNQRNPHITGVQQFFRVFRHMNKPFILGGTIFENEDLPVIEDLQVVPGARLTIAPGSILEFENGVGMIVQGELARMDFAGSEKTITFTTKGFTMPKQSNLRLVDEFDNDEGFEGRLEVLLDGNWGTVCNRSWTAQLALLACNQLGLVMDPQYFENWRIFPSPGNLPIVMDNVRCEEREFDLTKCRHDGLERNSNASCRPTEVVGIRCAEPRWAGIRYSLLANPPTVTGQSTMNNWIIEKAGLFDFRTAEFSAALQIDWNYHSFNRLTIRDNYWNGIEIIYNDLTRKPTIRDSRIERNRRNGIQIRSMGITVEEVYIEYNGDSGVRYEPRISAALQQDIISWLDRREQPELEANNIFAIPNHRMKKLAIEESHLNQRKFLVAKDTVDCPAVLRETCFYELEIEAVGHQYGLSAKIAVQLVHRASNVSDEDALFTDRVNNRQWSARGQAIDFPIVSSSNKLTMRYTRSYGRPQMIILLLFLDAEEYLDRFIHVYHSEINDNQYGISSMHYSNLSYPDGTVLNRYSEEKLWFQKVNFSRNSEAVIWVHSPQQDVVGRPPIAQITYHIDNCSITDNNGSVIDTHRDQYSSANVFHWIIWSCTLHGNGNSGISVYLPDTYDIMSTITHSFWMTESRFERNENFQILLAGFYAFANISSNNFTDNVARWERGLMELRGMEKNLIMERNRFYTNRGSWMVKHAIQSHNLRTGGLPTPAYIQYNYFLHNFYMQSVKDYVDMWPRSYAVGIFGAQKVDVHFNRFKNILLDFELISGCKPVNLSDTMNVTLNWWGTANDAEIMQRVFDFDDWNTFMLADYSPFYVTEEIFLDFWWKPGIGQPGVMVVPEPNALDLKGRMYQSKTLTLLKEKWYEFPYYYRPFRPYRIIKDLTIMPGATLTIERGVELHIWPNVRILVLGHIKAEGTYWEPIRFKPINTTELAEIRGLAGTRYRRSTIYRTRSRRTHDGLRFQDYLKKRERRASERIWKDSVYRQFPMLARADPYYQKFSVRLTKNGTSPRSGFLEMYNATTGELIPSCDRQFTIRNAQVVCRELGYGNGQNAYHWLTPRWDYNPKIHILKTYVEPRQCVGDERRLDDCALSQYIGNWGGITFSVPTLGPFENEKAGDSILRHVEIVGGGNMHNDTLQSVALQIVYRSPTIDRVNVTNSSMHGVQVVVPRDKLFLSYMNITDNHGQGLNILSTNLQTSSAHDGTPFGALTIPYNVYGLLDLCAAGKEVPLVKTTRVLIYYKYDSYPIDCIKVFISPGRKMAFRLLQANFYNPTNPLGRRDALRIFGDSSFSSSSLLAELFSNAVDTVRLVHSPTSTLALHMRATAADGTYGFIAEVTSLPSSPDPNPIEEIVISHSRLERNDRGAMEFRNTGEMSPNVVMDSCSINENGYFLFGNISTSSQALEFHLHNTLIFLFRSNSIWRNRGGLLISAHSSSSVARLNAVIKNNAFSGNSNSTTLAILGNHYAKVTVLNNVFTMNYALYHDTVIVKGLSSNFTENRFANNTGLHTVDLFRDVRIGADQQTFNRNFFEDNKALGHGHQYEEKYGYLSQREHDEFRRKDRQKRDIIQERQRRQVLDQKGISFDWWTHVDFDTERYRSTILAGSSQQHFYRNYFDNPDNDYELTTTRQSQFDMGAIDAKQNYWGYPGTAGVAAGKIRDQGDYSYLIKVEYMPVLESNTSLLEGDCPAGWFQAGVEEFKSCYIFIGAAMTYSNAVLYCQEQDAFVPYFRKDDSRLGDVARRLDIINQLYVTELERFNTYAVPYEAQVWVSSVDIPSTHCGWLSTRSGNIGMQNCENLLPFVCEKGTKPYQEPLMWRSAGVIFVVIISLLAAVIFILLCCWYYKSRQRKRDHFHRKESLRSTLRLNKLEEERMRERQKTPIQAFQTTPILKSKEDPIQKAHRSMVNGRPSSQDSLSTTTGTGTGTVTGTGTGTKTTTTSSRTYSSDPSYSPSESYYTASTLPSKTRTVSNTPNPYAEIGVSSPSRKPNGLNGPPPVKLRPLANTGQRRDTDLSTTSSTITCSTCPTDSSERDSTITEESSSWDDGETTSARSSATEDTVVGRRPLLPPPRGQQPMPKPFSDYFKGSGRPSTSAAVPPTVTRSNGNIIQPTPTQIPPPPPLLRRPAAVPPPIPPTFTPLGFDSRRLPRRQSSPPPPAVAPSRSLVDLHNPNWRSSTRNIAILRRNSADRSAPLETAM